MASILFAGLHLLLPRAYRFPKAGYIENIWDHCAGTVILEEAGGKVTDGTGAPLDYSMGR